MFSINVLAVTDYIRMNCTTKACRLDLISFPREGAKLFSVLVFFLMWVFRYYFPDHLYPNRILIKEKKENFFFFCWLFVLSLPSALLLELLVKIHGRSWEATCHHILNRAADFLCVYERVCVKKEIKSVF